MTDPFAELGSYVFVSWMIIAEWILKFFGFVPEEANTLYNLVLLFLFAFTFLLWHWYVKAIIRFGEIIYYNFKARLAKTQETIRFIDLKNP